MAAPLSTAEKFYIEEHRSDDVGEIAEEIKRHVKTVQKHIDSLPPVSVKEQETIVKKKLAVYKVGKKKIGVAMTESSSMAADEKNINKETDKDAMIEKEKRKEFHKQQIRERNEGRIHRMH